MEEFCHYQFCTNIVILGSLIFKVMDKGNKEPRIMLKLKAMGVFNWGGECPEFQNNQMKENSETAGSVLAKEYRP